MQKINDEQNIKILNKDWSVFFYFHSLFLSFFFLISLIPTQHILSKESLLCLMVKYHFSKALFKYCNSSETRDIFTINGVIV